MERPAEPDPRGGPRRVTRRSVLASCVATVGVLAVVPESGRARQGTTTAVIPSPEDWADTNLAGYMIHVGGPQDPIQTREAENCDYRDWPPDEIRAYEATIINRKDADTPEQDTNLHISADVAIPTGALYLINTFDRCENGYIGVQLEQIGRRDVPMSNESDAPVVEVEDDSRPNTQTEGAGAIGPGFGVLATLGGVLGAGVLVRLVGGDDGDESR